MISRLPSVFGASPQSGEKQEGSARTSIFELPIEKIEQSAPP
jgi:hypothetical protein